MATLDVLFLAAAAQADFLAGLTIAPENRCPHYNSDDYRHLQSVEGEIIRRMGGRIFARSCGAREVVISTNGAPAAAVREITGGRGAEIVFDAIGGATFAQSLAMLASRGQLVSYG